MKSSKPSRVLVIVTLLSALLSSAVARPATAAVSREERHKFEAWRKSMARVPLPKKGCFKASYPSTEWHEVTCTTAPVRPYAPRPFTVGSAVDFSAVVAGHIASATGSFDSVNGVTSETNLGSPDTYSLQLNSEYFASPACAGSSNPNVCKGWQQFIYSTSLASAFIEYWLIDYAAPCPAGWTTVSIHCLKNSTAVPVPAEPIANLIQLSLNGTATAAGIDTITVGTSNGNLSAMAQDDVLSLAQGWKLAEFGIFGDGGGSDATFNVGATMAVRTTVDDGTSNAPTCVLEGFTSETNSLNLVPPCCPYGGAFPAVVFWLSSNPGATSSCVGGTSIGDTHLTNFNGLFYDFQASGDFLLAETNPGFVVQTRQKSGAPTWPNASVNKAVAMTLGNTRAAVCLDPTRLIVDGQQRDLGNDQSLSLPNGVHIARSGNAYLFTRPSGESVRAEVNNPGYINVSVDLGAPPQAKVYGLLGNANGNMGEDDLATRYRMVLKQPITFNDLYHPYANSWRITPSDSLLSTQCGDRDVDRGTPDRPFYANDLNPREYEGARAICTEAGVRDETLLDACILDVTVLGTREAATVFARMHPPRAELRVSSGRRER